MSDHMSKMNIVQFIDTFYPKIDGVAGVANNYAAILNSYDDVSCCVFCPEVDRNYKDEFPYDVIRSKSLPLLPDYRLPAPKLSSGLEREFIRRKPDIVHAHSPFTLGHYGLSLAEKYDVPFVTTFHSKYYDDFLQYSHSKLIAEQLLDYILKFYGRADSVWAVGSGSADTLRGYGYKGDIVIMDNATSMVYPEDPEACRRLLSQNFDIPKTGKNLLFVGRITKQKNLYFVLDTLRCIRDKDIRLIVVGDGTELNSLKRYAEEAGIADSVTFTGEIRDPVLLKSFYLESDLFFFPSLYDSSPLALREAAALRVPALVIRGSSSADPITEGQNGFFCDESPETAAREIEEIFSDPEKLKQAGAAAAETIGISWERRIPEVLEKYKEIISGYHKKSF